VDLISRGAELGAISREPDSVDRTEAVFEMNREHRYEHHDDERYTYDGHECTREQRKAAKEFNQGTHPCHHLRHRRPRVFKHPPKPCRAAAKLRPTVRHEAESDNHPNGYGSPP